MKPKFSMCIYQRQSSKSIVSTKADMVVAKKETNTKATVAWCVENSGQS